ncbi:MAG: hypothetical protein QOE68_1598 [Thermoanaerobaculia bacterium]|jgi:hypothetical protein|nr:hypothetical protein [Thermoanaerobaculia bacterium]
MFVRCSILFVLLGTARLASAQEMPYFLTYTHHMEEPGSLEIAVNPVFGVPKGGARRFAASSLELEYGVNGWWTSELYLDAQKTGRDSALYTGWRFENRFRLLMKEHAVNPVLYVEYEDITGADRIFKEVVGFDTFESLLEPADETRHEKKREVEAKLILSTNRKGWNVAGNLIAEKNLSGEPVEFGYAAALSRPLALAASPDPCSLCRENFSLGVELYGGFGEWRQVRLAGTSHYIAPAIAWNLPNGLTFKFSPSFGVNSNSNRALVRFGVSYEIPLAFP